jgi:putative membrane protein
MTAFLSVGAFFMVNVEMPPWAYLVSGLNIVLFAAPSMWATIKWLGWKNGLILLVLLGIYATLIETFAILTGYPYGNFSYSDLLGFRVFGVVPWTVAFAWTPLILAAYAIGNNLISNLWLRIFVIAGILLIFDLVLDPGAVYMKFWKYSHDGFFYGVPLSNFAGWIISGIIGAGIFEFLIYHFQPSLPSPKQMILSAYFIIIFWTFIAFWAGMVLPFLIGIGIITFLSWFYIKFSQLKYQT